MSAIQVESGGKGKSVDIDINLVPFIDLMSCLVAFLLVTAAWTNVAQISMKPKGVGRDSEVPIEDKQEVRMSVLIAADATWVGMTTGDRREIKKNGDDYNWPELQKTITEFRNSGVLKEYSESDDKGNATKYYQLEIGAEDGVKYQDIISTMDTALSENFKDIGYVDPGSLSVRFKQ